MDDNKAKALAAALQQIEKQFGKGSIMKMGDAEIDEGLQVVSTGSLGLDLALGVGGLPRGRVVEIYGPESSARPPCVCRSSPKCRSSAARRLSSMPNMRLIRSTHRNSASMSANC